MAVAEMIELHPGADDVRRRFDGIIAELCTASTSEALRLSDEFQNKLLALDAELLAQEIAAGANERKAEELAGRGTTRIKKEARKRANRARAVNENPELAHDLRSGKLTPDGLDAIATVAEQSDGAAARDEDLVEQVSQAPPDLAGAITKRWLEDHTSPDEHEKRYARQRRLRKLTRYFTRDGLDGIKAEGDRESIDEIWSVLSAESKRLYRKDGGREVPTHKHPRTRDQRLYDALHTAVSVGDPAGEPKRNVQVYVTLTLEELLDEPTKARLVGGGPVPSSLLEQYLADSSIAGVLFDGNGHVLWHGRSKRYATLAQTSALTVRDEGCVLCNSPPADCHGHHLTPYNSPGRGKTNTDELALVCSDCHQHIHGNNLTLTCESRPRTPGKLTWKLRSATPDELPPAGQRSARAEASAPSRLTEADW